MTLGEYRAWLEGFSASFAGGAPNADQWAEVQRRLALVAEPASLGPMLDRLADPLRLYGPQIPSTNPLPPGWLQPPPVTCRSMALQSGDAHLPPGATVTLSN